jgi:cell division initiation protein
MGLEKHENLLKDTLVTAQKATTDIKDNARKECELLITKAKMDAENMKKDAMEQIRKLQEKINELESYKINLIGQTKALITNVSVLLDKELSQKKG